MTTEFAMPDRARDDTPAAGSPAMRRCRRARAVAASLVAAVMTVAAPASGAEDAALCTSIERIVAAAPKEFRALRDSEYSTKFESWRSSLTLDGFDACWIDDVSRSFWCLLQAPDMAAAAARAERTLAGVSDCLPAARQQQLTETMDNNVTRQITDWIVDDARRLRLVHRYPTRPPGLAAVFLYVY
ncbi:MAG: hypothetical protein JNK67_03850 [Alphaproteobacteria bacterium]|nr:hypothetical protein [Alphaproteobacteria bacterium]